MFVYFYQSVNVAQDWNNELVESEMGIVFYTAQKIRSLKPKTDHSNERSVYGYIYYISIHACLTILVQRTCTMIIPYFTYFYPDDVLLHFAEAKRLPPLSNATDL